MSYLSKSSLQLAAFRPFFITISITIGATEQGTGLGLSLSYDIAKAHGRELNVATQPAGWPGKESEGSEFIIIL